MGQELRLQTLRKKGMHINCADCIFLNKEEKRVSGDQYFYGCDRRVGRFCVGWVRKDSELRTQGCSDCNKLKPGDVFIAETVLKTKVTMLYCGKVTWNGADAYLCYVKHTTKSNPLTEERYRTYGQFTLRDLYRSIQFVPQNEAQREASKRLAKKRKQKWRETHGKEKG